MDFSETEIEKTLAAKYADLGATLNDGVMARDQSSAFAHAEWLACGQAGALGLPITSEYGGQGLNSFQNALVGMEALGTTCKDIGLLFAISAHAWTVALPILLHGSDAQKERYLPQMCSGHIIGAHALTEPDAGSDVFSMTTTALPCDGGYRLNGQKHLVSLAPIADLFLLFALTDPSKGKWGVSGFLIDKDTPGLRVSENKEKMGLRSTPWGDVTLEECFVPTSARLSGQGSGLALIQRSLDVERCSILAAQVGAMTRQLNETVAFAKSRQQFGQSIGKFQAVSHRIADMKIRVEMARLLLRKVAWMLDQGKPAAQEAAMLKLMISEGYVESSLDAIRIRGGTGYLTETGLERELRDSVGGVIYAGTSDIQRNIIAAMLGL